MATIDSRAIIDAIIAGEYDDEPDLAVKIVEYTNAWGKVTWGVVYRSEARGRLGTRYEQPSEYVRHPKVIWERPVAGHP
jgi:hypothetical protein